MSTILCPRYCVHDTVSTILCPRHCVHDTVSTILCPRYCVHDTGSTILCPRHCVHDTVSTTSRCLFRVWNRERLVENETESCMSWQHSRNQNKPVRETTNCLLVYRTELTRLKWRVVKSWCLDSQCIDHTAFCLSLRKAACFPVKPSRQPCK